MAAFPKWDRSQGQQGSDAPAFVPGAAGAGQGNRLSKPGGETPGARSTQAFASLGCSSLSFPSKKAPLQLQGCCPAGMLPPLPGDLCPWDAWVSWGAQCGRAVALNQQLDPAVTASNPRRSLAQAFYAFCSGSRGAWRQRAGETGLTLASREGRGKGKHFPSQRSRGSPMLRLWQRARGEQAACGAAAAA